jgi:iron complex outermembrane recepter protein
MLFSNASRRVVSAGFIAGVTALLVSTGFAQQATPTTVTPGAGETTALEEIVVTAQKRSEDIQHVPIAMSAITAETLKNNRVETTQDIQNAVPALQYQNLGGYGEPYLRGIGTDFTQPNADASVATYIDGAYVASDQAIITNLLGVERVEVLEGPQGTLYGRNATGGAINIITLTPTEETSAELSVTGGDYDRREMAGHLSGAVSDTLFLGVYAAGVWTNPYVRDLSPLIANGTVTTDSSRGIRVKAVWEPASNLKFTFSAEATDSQQFEPYAWRNVAPSYLGQLFGSTTACCEYTTIDAGQPIRALNPEQSVGLREEYDLGWANLVGISNYRTSFAQDSDNTGSVSIPLLEDAADRIFSRQVSQELQLLSPEGQAWKWVGGLYYFHENAGFRDLIEGSSYFPLDPTDGMSAEDQNSSAKTNSYAVFAQTDIPLQSFVPGLTLTLGGRYSIDKKEHYGTDTWYGAGALNSCGSVYSLSPSCATLLTPAWNPGGPAATTPFPDLQHEWHNFSPKVTLSEQFDSNNLAYFTYAEGYKSGVYNLPSGSNPGPVNPEKLKDYEVGTKSTLLDQRLQVNLAAYYYKYSEIQVEIVTPLLQTLLTNAASAEAYGFETSMKAALTSELRANLGLSLEHSRYTRFGSEGCTDPSNECFSGVNFSAPVSPAASINATGNQLPHAPEAVVTVGLDYEHQVSAAGKIHGNINVYHNSGFWWTAQNGIDGGFRQPQYTLLNLSGGYRLPGDHWDFTGWITNATNAFYNMGFTPVASFGALALPAAPRMFGGTVTYRFQ